MEMTYEALMKIQHSINRDCQNSPAYAYFHRTQIDAFFKKNALRLTLANKKLAELFEAHVQKDEKGNWLTIQKDALTTDWEFKSPEDEAQYKEAYETFMSRMVDVH